MSSGPDRNDNVVTAYLPSLVPQNLPVPAASRFVDVAAEDRQVTYFKIKELSDSWERVYSGYIEQALWEVDHIGDAEKRLEEVIRSFDKSLNELGPVITEQQIVTPREVECGDTS